MLTKLTKVFSSFEASTSRWYMEFLLTRIATARLGLWRSAWKEEDQVLANSIKGASPLQFQGVAQREKSGEGLRIVSPLPIVFIHYKNADYLKYSLAQARKSNPDSPIYLIGDEANDCYDFIEHHSYRDYFREASEFAKIYRHFCDQDIRWILFVFQRWFILKEFLIANRLDKCLHIDSDVMLYANVTKDQEKFSQYGFTVSHRICGSVFFLNWAKALESFCQFLMDIYSGRDQYYYDKMLTHFMCRQKSRLRGGATEMTALDYYGEAHFGEIGEVSLIIDGSVYDPNINTPHPGFAMENGIKKIIWENDEPFGIHISTARKIKFNALHFQGRAKRLMKQFCTSDLAR